ncbi:MAG: 1-acyl-sn-glycerol-3-phosphate acyltransferase [Ruminococcaceae bacterium]|nr:1-acyl-sn-glycerol-3-phosphate acyltransferase [Oscillospiraceae bacterium]
MAKKGKTKKWMRFRHRVVRNIAWAILTPYSRIKYGIRVERFRDQEKRPYLILMNHQTPFDQFFVGMAFKGPIYYLATEDIFSNGFISSLIKYLVAPIPIKKQTADVKAIMNCLRVAKEGGTIALAPEGNRTYSGRTEYMSSAIAPLAKRIKVPIALFRIEGGYGVQPRWSDVIRKGKMRGYVSRVIYPEEYASISDDELFDIIEKGLYVDEAVNNGEYKHKKCAEYLERAVYVCPFCGLSEFESNGDVVKCKRCDRSIRYLSTKEIEGINCEFPYRFVADWYDAQEDFINALDVREYTNEPMYREAADIYDVVPCVKKQLIGEGVELSLYGDRIEINNGGDTLVCTFDQTQAVTVLGRNKLNIYHDKNIYQIKGGKRFNALKYVHIYHRYKNIVRGDENGKFLGL